MRSIATLNLEFGMLTLPMGISTFADYQPIKLSNVCPHGHRIKMKRVCPDCDNKEIPYSDLKKAFVISKDKQVVFDADLVKLLKEKQDKGCRVLRVFKQDMTYKFKYLIQKVYYLSPKANFEKGYFIMRNALASSGNSLLIDYMVRSRKHLGLVEPFGKFLILFQLIYAEQIRTPTPLKELATSEKDITNARVLLDSIYEQTKSNNIKNIKDEYKKELFEAILTGKKIRKAKVEDDFSRKLALATKTKKKAKKKR